MVKSYHLAQCRPISVWNWTERSRTVITLKHCAKTIHARFAADAICGFRMGRWCHDIAHSCLVSDLFNCWVGYCAPARCRSAHTCLIDGVLNDALRIITGCLRPTPTDNLPALSDIQPAELRRQGAILSLANCSSLDPGLILHGQVTEPGLLARRDQNPDARLFLPRGNYCTTYLSWASALRNGRTWHGTQSTPRVCQRLVSTFLGLSQDPLEWVWPEQLGSNLIACVLALGVSVRPCTNGVLLLERNASVALVNKLQTTLF